MRLLRYVLLFICAWGLITSCSTTKYVPEGQYLLESLKIKIDNNEVKETDLEYAIQQNPNLQLLGLAKTSLNIYSMSGTDSSKWINRMLRRWGDPPVIYDSLATQRSIYEIRQTLRNMGYEEVEATADVEYKKKKAYLTYQVKPSDPYKIRNIEINIYDSLLQNQIIFDMQTVGKNIFEATAMESVNATPIKGSLLERGDRFDRMKIDEERGRIVTALRRKGYYDMNREYIAYLADSTVGNKSVDLTLYVRPPMDSLPIIKQGERFDPSILPRHTQYSIDSIYIYTGFDPMNLGGSTPVDTVEYLGYNIIQGPFTRIKPYSLELNTFITPGGLYNERLDEQTYSAMAAMSALKGATIRYNRSSLSDSLLNCHVSTINSNVRGIGLDIEGTNTAGNLGAAASANFQHRNIFGGSEVLSLKARGAYEAIASDQWANYFELGGEVGLNFPAFIFPFLNHNTMKKIKASTEFSLAYNLQTRPELDRTITSGGWKYVWQNRFNGGDRHTVRLIDIDYVYIPRMDSIFKANLSDNTLLFSYTDQFIMSTGYSYLSTNENPFIKTRNKYTFRLSVELAGNILNAISTLADAPKNQNGSRLVFNIPFAQYAKGDFDFSRTFIVGEDQSLAFRTAAGIAVPYGNSSIIPFERRYFSGGSNSVRGWNVRELGPGGYRLNPTTNFLDQSGDIKLDLNLEYRAKIIKYFEFAGYIDAGNIWTIRDYDFQPNGVFRLDKFYEQIALSAGIGLRMDFDFFLVRFDTGYKIYNPMKRDGQRWSIIHDSFGNNFAWHFAVGYPF